MGINKIDNRVMDKVANILREYNLSEIEYKNGEEYIKLTSALKPVSQIVVPGNNVGNMISHICQNDSQYMNTDDANKVKSHSLIAQDNTYDCDESSESIGCTDYSDHPGAVKSPIVGTCYLAPSPDAPKYVEVGQDVRKDDPIMILEAMKVMNVIKAPKDGKLVHIAVEDKDPVEYNQLLFVID